MLLPNSADELPVRRRRKSRDTNHEVVCVVYVRRLLTLAYKLDQADPCVPSIGAYRKTLLGSTWTSWNGSALHAVGGVVLCKVFPSDHYSHSG